MVYIPYTGSKLTHGTGYLTEISVDLCAIYEAWFDLSEPCENQNDQ